MSMNLPIKSLRERSRIRVRSPNIICIRRNIHTMYYAYYSRVAIVNRRNHPSGSMTPITR